MRAYVLNGANGIDSLDISVRPTPEPKRGQIIISMKAWSLNQRDLMVIKGNYNGLQPVNTIPLSDGAGEVVAVGQDVTRFKIGDRVSPTFTGSWVAGTMTAADPALSRGAAVDGVLAEFVACEESLAVHIPSHLTYQEAACFPCAGVTAWNALFGPAPLTCGQTVLTLGTGGVSTFAIQFAALSGARVISTSSSDQKLEHIRALGASETINYRTHPEWEQEVLRLTNGRGVDHVVEVGGGGTLNRSVASTAVGGQIHMIGALSGGSLNPRTLLPWKTLRGIMVGSAADHRAMNRMVEHHRIRPVINRTFKFEDVRDAYQYLESASHVGKVVITSE